MIHIDILRKKYCDVPAELYEMTSRLMVDTSTMPQVTHMKAYVQPSENNLKPLEEAIKKFVQRVRDDTKTGKKVFTCAEQAGLNAQYEEAKLRREETRKRYFLVVG